MRRGFSLVELLIATAIAGVAAAFTTVTLVRQQKFFSGASEVLAVRAELRDGADILVSDIRTASTATFGLPVMTDTAIEMISVIATSVACGVPAGNAIGLPPAALTAGHSLTSILTQPDTGDVVMIFGSAQGADSAAWEMNRVVSFAPRLASTVCPASTGFTNASDAASPGYMITLAASPSAKVGAGAPIHFLRRARYSFYRSSDGDWYLGYRRCGVAPPNSCAAIQPVSGPYRPYRGNGAPGLSFRYYDVNGVLLTDASQSYKVARVEIVLRGESRGMVAFSADSRRSWRDSVVVSVAPRNADR